MGLSAASAHDSVLLEPMVDAVPAVKGPRGRPGRPRRRPARLQAGLHALVEQAIAHLANAWALRRWRGLLYRVRDVYRAAGALICLGRWLHRVPA